MRKTDNFGQITLTPIVLENSGLEGKAAQLMENKLNILLTQHSMAGWHWTKFYTYSQMSIIK